MPNGELRTEDDGLDVDILDRRLLVVNFDVNRRPSIWLPKAETSAKIGIVIHRLS